MEERNLKLAQNDVDEALKAIENIEKFLEGNESSKDLIKERFLFLSNKVLQLETILKIEGILWTCPAKAEHQDFRWGVYPLEAEARNYPL